MGGIVLCVCRSCGRRFERSADVMVITGKSKPPPASALRDPSRCRTVTQWISCMGEWCDDCIPTPPRAVLDDYVREEMERAADRRVENRSVVIGRREHE